MKVPRDARDKLWGKMEREIQLRAKNKDKKFQLKGKWKQFVRKQSGYRVYAVNERWVRDNLCIYFCHGGNGVVHEFIPLSEIWVGTRHYDEGKNSEFSKCPCTVNRKNQKVSKNFFDSTALHEITECEQMKKGRGYWVAHNIALEAERKAGLLKDPYEDIV